jgi:hypothetical protein
MISYKDTDVLELMMHLEKIAQVQSLAGDQVRTLALQYLDRLIDPAQSITAEQYAGLKAGDLASLSSILTFVKEHSITSYNQPITTEEDMSDNPGYVYYDGVYVNKTGLKNYLDHLHVAMANDPVNRPLLDNLIAEVNTQLPDMAYKPAERKDNKSTAQPGTVQQTQQQQTQQHSAMQSAISMPLPLDYTDIDFARIERWINAVAQLPEMVNKYQTLFTRINDALQTLAGASGVGLAPIDLTTRVDSIYTNTRNNARAVAQSMGHPSAATNVAHMFLQELMVFMDNVKSVISALRNAGVPDDYREKLDQQIQFANVAENQIGRWQSDLPNAVERVEGAIHR